MQSNLTSLYTAINDLYKRIAALEATRTSSDVIEDLLIMVQMAASEIKDLQTDVTALETSVEALEDDTLVKDFFTINDTDIDVTGASTFDLVVEPCIEGPSIMSFYLTVNIDGSRATV